MTAQHRARPGGRLQGGGCVVLFLLSKQQSTTKCAVLQAQDLTHHRFSCVLVTFAKAEALKNK